MIEAALLTFAIALIVLLVRNCTRSNTEDPDQLLGIFAYKQDKNDLAISHRERKPHA